jgi:hypothetical protein
MPAIGYDLDKRRNRRGEVRRSNRRRSSQRGTGRSLPLEIIGIETLSMLVFGERVDGGGKVNVRETWRRAASQQDAQSGHTHDRGAVRSQSAVAFPEGPDKRHVSTPLR